MWTFWTSVGTFWFSVLDIFCKVLWTGPISHVGVVVKQWAKSFTTFTHFIEMFIFISYGLETQKHVSVDVKHSATSVMHENILCSIRKTTNVYLKFYLFHK